MGIRVVVERIALYGVSTLLFIDSLTKIFPNLIPDATNELDRKFVEYSTVCVTSMFGYEPNPIHYKIVVGSWEICSAIGLLFHDVRQMASVILGIMMLGAIQTYINLQEYTETIFPAVFFLTLCYIYGMTNRESAKMKVKED